MFDGTEKNDLNELIEFILYFKEYITGFLDENYVQ